MHAHGDESPFTTTENSALEFSSTSTGSAKSNSRPRFSQFHPESQYTGRAERCKAYLAQLGYPKGKSGTKSLGIVTRHASPKITDKSGALQRKATIFERVLRSYFSPPRAEMIRFLNQVYRPRSGRERYVAISVRRTRFELYARNFAPFSLTCPGRLQDKSVNQPGLKVFFLAIVTLRSRT